MMSIYRSTVTILVYIALLFFVIIFLFSGTDDAKQLSTIFEKVATINFSVAIGYAALVPAIASLASHNTSQNPVLKSDIHNFIRLIVIYVLLNMMIVIISFVYGPQYSIFMGRLLVTILVLMLMYLSHYLLKLAAKLIF